MMKMVTVGVDPGLDGALAFLYPTGEVRCFGMPVVEIVRNGKHKREIDPVALGDLVFQETDKRTAVAFVEKVGAMPGQGTSSMFSFGKSYGVVLGVLAALQIETHHPTPQAWQKALNVRDGKEGSLLRAGELMPLHRAEWKPVKGVFDKKQAIGRAEAALIAKYGQLQS
jgi:crossover junction endodeoxyribonuclease RuvC